MPLTVLLSKFADAKVSINFELTNVFLDFFWSERGFMENLTAAAGICNGR